MFYKNYSTIEKLALDMKMKATTIHDTITHTSNKVQQALQDAFINPQCLEDLLQCVQPQDRYINHCLLVVYSVFYASTWPMGAFSSDSHWYSPKHCNYRVKYQLIHSREGRVVGFSKAHPASVHDKTMFIEDINFIDAIFHDDRERSMH